MPQSLLDTGAFLNGACGRPKDQGKPPVVAFAGGKSGSKSTRPVQSQLSSLATAHRQVMQAVNPFMAHRCGYNDLEGGLMT